MAMGRVVVGLDFGTTFSGFAFAHRSNPTDVQLFFDWPNAGRTYCKTLTALFYSPSSGNWKCTYKLEDWGWSALDKYATALQAFQSRCALDERDPSADDVRQEVGVIVTNFKLLLADDKLTENLYADFPVELDAERVIVDYLRCMSEFVIEHLNERYRNTIRKRDIQWCVTVPAMWSDKSKHKMHAYARMAGLVDLMEGGNDRPEVSLYPLKIILEPEAASSYCQIQHKLELCKGDKFIVTDLGGGTMDVVVHEIADEDSDKVYEVAASYGELGGGAYVDESFFQFLKTKIGCFETFGQHHPEAVRRIYNCWNSPLGKLAFDGTLPMTLEIPRKLSKAWREHDNSGGSACTVKSDDFYEELEISSQDMRDIFEAEVSKAIKLIRDKLRPSIKYIFLVGGFAENRYLLKRVRAELGGFVRDVIAPSSGGAAICRGAVAIGLRTNFILSRVSKRWYGIRGVAVGSHEGRDFRFDGMFGCFVKKNESVLEGQSVTRRCFPACKDQKIMRITVYSSSNEEPPKFVTDPGCEEIGSYALDISEDMHLGQTRIIEISFYFGKATVEVYAQRVNFGTNRRPQRMCQTQFGSPNIASQDHPTV